MRFFINEILEDEEARHILETQAQLKEEGKYIADKIAIEGDAVLPPVGLLPLFVLAHLADYALEKNTARCIPKEITVATLKDVNVWLHNYRGQYGQTGLAEFPWLIKHYTGNLFQLGRLQFRLAPALPGMPGGTIAIETHVPQGEPLDTAACLSSFAQAKGFFSQHFPAYAPTHFMCDSWLLCRNLTQVLHEESNIVKFMRLWHPIPFPSDNSAQAIERIFGFGFSPERLAEAPEYTSLQRKVKDYLLRGGSLDISAGYRELSVVQ